MTTATALEFGSPYSRRQPSTRTPEEREAARQRYERSPAFQARIRLEQDRLRERQADRDRRDQAFASERQSRAALRAKDNLGPEDKAFAERGFEHLGKEKEAVTRDIGAAMKAMSESAPGLWKGSEPARTMEVAHRSMQEYVAGNIGNGALHKAIKDMVHANPPTAADRQTGEIKPDRAQVVNAWNAARDATDKVIETIRSTDRRLHPARAPAAEKSPSR